MATKKPCGIFLQGFLLLPVFRLAYKRLFLVAPSALKYTLPILFLLFSFSVSGQLNEAFLYGTYDKTEVGKSFCRSNDGGYIVTGEQVDSVLFPLRTTFIFKIDSAGQLVWSKTLWKNSTNTIADIIPTFDGNYLITGSGLFDSTKSYDIYLVKINDAGNMIWAESFGTNAEDGGYLIKHTPDGGFIIGGFTMVWTSQFNGHGVIYLVKTDPGGVVQWANSYDGGVNDYFRDLLIDPAGGYFLTGYSRDSGVTYSRAFFMKVDSTGNVTWSRKLAAKSTTSACKLLPNGNFLVAGSCNRTGMFVLEIDRNHNILRAKGPYLGVGPRQIFQKSNGDFLFAVTDALRLDLLKADSSLNFLWCHTFQNFAVGDGRLAYAGIQISDSLLALLCSSSLRSNDVLVRYVSEAPSLCDDSLPVSTINPDTTMTLFNVTVRSGATNKHIIAGDSLLFLEYNTACGNNIETGIHSVISNHSFDFYPNPFSSLLYVHAAGPGHLQIFDMTSKVVLGFFLNEGETAINLESLTAGIYIVGFVTERGSEFRKMIKTD